MGPRGCVGPGLWLLPEEPGSLCCAPCRSQTRGFTLYGNASASLPQPKPRTQVRSSSNGKVTFMQSGGACNRVSVPPIRPSSRLIGHISLCLRRQPGRGLTMDTIR
ncbi:uncharacterized protein BDZ83DRAFT_647616 [Colletotrichum acutatum]|uniref:Uncharacterized protein n=1 Tax=Glomerella acutata TaxID=27357 RepID=A0AAD8XLP1_GLOAC|nr:uncharacterized protein BDZ83DRAFT_647616 [Colletotrichum acutatum]KAK1729675.1 hypothetical protein BDZ83DRAFT_647616 [Colletotrichum acutatum]